jgi:hypothetical protein
MPSTQRANIDELNMETASFGDFDSVGGNEQTDYNQIYYPSNCIGGSLRNAMDGCEYPCKRGDRAELRYFKMIDSRNVLNNDGRRRHHTDTNEAGRDPNMLYYESPEQYMQHCKQQRLMGRPRNLTAKQINAWHVRKNRLFPRERNYIAEDGNTVFKAGELNENEYKKYLAEKIWVDPEIIEAEAVAATGFRRHVPSYHLKGCPSKLGFTSAHVNPGLEINHCGPNDNHCSCPGFR